MRPTEERKKVFTTSTNRTGSLCMKQATAGGTVCQEHLNQLKRKTRTATTQSAARNNEGVATSLFDLNLKLDIMYSTTVIRDAKHCPADRARRCCPPTDSISRSTRRHARCRLFRAHDGAFQQSVSLAHCSRAPSCVGPTGNKRRQATPRPHLGLLVQRHRHHHHHHHLLLLLLLIHIHIHRRRQHQRRRLFLSFVKTQ
jgi:hypothetical protein